jgi:hypothetical protein
MSMTQKDDRKQMMDRLRTRRIESVEYDEDNGFVIVTLDDGHEPLSLRFWIDC